MTDKQADRREQKRQATVSVDLEDLQRRLQEAEATLTAIRHAEVDAIVVSGPEGPVTYTLAGADEPYRLLVEQIQEAALTLTDDGVILYTNSRLPQMLQCDHGSALGAKLADLLAAGDRALLSALLQRARTGSAKAELALRRADGAAVPVLLSLTGLATEAFTGLFAVITDLTEQQRSAEALEAERLMRAVFDQVTHAILLCSDDGTVIRANPIAGELCGTNPLLQPFDAVFPLERPFAELVAQSHAGRPAVECSLRRSDGREFDLLLGIRALTHDRARAWVITLTDISERKRAERLVDQARALAEAANQAKSEFLTTMSHEIRTPISAVLGYADILSRRLNDADDLAAADTIRRNGQHLLALINDILDLSKIEAGRLGMVSERFAPAALIADVMALMDIRAREKELTLAVEFDGLLPETIASDPRRLKQILLNLIGNAIKFTTRGGVTLRVGLIEGENRIRFAVLDTGIGIDVAEQQRLFEPFTQVDSTVTRHHGGSGLGLAISRRLAQLLGGEITLQSRPQQGSTFTLTVATGALHGIARVRPSLAAAATDGAADAAPCAEAVGERLQGRFLVVDDRVDICHLLSRYLQDAGATVDAVSDGQAALATVAAAAAGTFRAVVLDMQMPQVDGYTVARRLRAQGFSAPIVATTAHAMEGDREKCLSAGCSDYLSKPVRRQDLVALLARLTAAEPASRPAPAGAPRVLVVDDSADAANALAEMLGLLGYRTSVAFDGETALTAIRAQRPGIVVLDLNLPDISGYEVVRRVRAETEQPRQPRFIALSGEDQAGAQAAAAGFDHHVLKPVSARDLVKYFD